MSCSGICMTGGCSPVMAIVDVDDVPAHVHIAGSGTSKKFEIL